MDGDQYEEVKAPPMKLSWSNVSYDLQIPYSKKQRIDLGTEDKSYWKQIVKPQSGYANHGETLFIMGSSGAGKTSFLNLLCDRIPSSRKNKLQGEVLLNDSLKVSQSNFGKYGAYVMQDDILFQTLT